MELENKMVKMFSKHANFSKKFSVFLIYDLTFFKERNRIFNFKYPLTIK